MRQWQTIASAVPTIDLDAPSRIRGWRNREVVAHLTLQPILLRRILRTASAREPRMKLSANLDGTSSLADLIDVTARHDAELGRLDFRRAVDDALPELRASDLAVTVETVQGSMVLVDYLITRCVEAVVHGRDLVEPVEPDPTAEAITARALLDALAERAPRLVRVAQDLPSREWIDVATGRRSCSGELATAVPVMT